ncbi:hypothetical protein CK203_045684 [Vitis vinifera]|uniref:Uncharacterized protein n=1 Tax=Vitis vinifera TaxID=29760 RepID=A0A438HQA3_VITVI|nr:hypothetical protein CK203_045684 [Vitis vinifera]
MDKIELYIKQVPIQPRVRGQLLGNFTHLLLRENDNVEEFEYGCGPSSALVVMNYECKEDEDEEECESQEDDDQSERAEDVQHDGHGVFEFMDEENNNVNVVSSFLTLTKQWKVNKGDMSQTHRKGLCVISDRHLGIMAAMSNVHLEQSQQPRLKNSIKHMNTIGRINVIAQQWLEAIPFEKWVLSHDRGRREQGVNQLASNEEYTPYVDAKIKANVVKAGSHEIVYMITSKDDYM